MATTTDKLRGDALAFLGQGQMAPPIAHELLPQHLKFAICTAAIPVGRDLEQTTAEVIEYRQAIDGQPQLEVALNGTGFDDLNDRKVSYHIDGDTVTVVCQIVGQNVDDPDNGSSNLWAKLDSGYYISDLFINTPKPGPAPNLPTCA